MSHRRDRARRRGGIPPLAPALTACAPEPAPRRARRLPRRRRRRPHADRPRTRARRRRPQPQIPSDCREILSDDVLAELGGTPLERSGLRAVRANWPDGSLVCIWADPAADTTGLTDDDHQCRARSALEQLNALATTRASRATRPTAARAARRRGRTSSIPVIDGRTVFWRDDILVDTTYSDLCAERLHIGDRGARLVG